MEPPSHSKLTDVNYILCGKNNNTTERAWQRIKIHTLTVKDCRRGIGIGNGIGTGELETESLHLTELEQLGSEKNLAADLALGVNHVASKATQPNQDNPQLPGRPPCNANLCNNFALRKCNN